MQMKQFDLSSAALHILAMLLMLCDHTWAMLLPQQEWLTWIGRIAFPIFAFMCAEGYRHTHDVKKYLQRLLIFALISEIPFNLMYSLNVFYPFHQNVLWTFIIAILLMMLMDRIKEKYQPMLSWLLCGLVMLLGFTIGFVTFVDYYGVGVCTVLLFYLFPSRDLISRVLQFVGMYILHIGVLGGYYHTFHIFGLSIDIYQQAFALLALIPIWLYKGRQGYHSKPFQYLCYGFYPIHMLVLYLIYASMY